MTTKLLDCIEQETGPAPRHTVIWLHGLGADGHDFVPIVPELLSSHLPPVRFIFPHAPQRPVTINQGMTMRAWYDIVGFGPEAHEDLDGIRASRHAIMDLIVRELERGIPSTQIVLAGFSQGCAIALYTGLRMDQPLAGIIGLSGYLPLRNMTATEAHPANASVPIFMAHGTLDPVVDLSRGEISRDMLLELGYAPQWHTYPMPHAVHPQEIADIRDFLVSVLRRDEAL
ncbi:MAG TPA: carboxylesterase [Castellaniella sp.]|nr:carboxylesterase [Castellaniella sp.]